MKRLVVIFGVLALALAIVVSGCAQPAAVGPQKFIWNHSTFETMYTAPWTKFYQSKITELSGGKMTFEMYWAESLGFKAATYLKVSRDGLAPFSDGFAEFMASDVPELTILSLPMLAPFAEDADKVRAKVEHLAAKVLGEKWNSVLLANYPGTPQAIWTSKPVKTWKDFAGMKVRILTAPESEFIKAIGAIPVTVPWPEVYTALQRKTIDAVVTTDDGVWTQKLYEVVKYRPVAGERGMWWFNFASKNSWDGLPQEFQKAVNDAKPLVEDFVIKDHKNLAVTDVGKAASLPPNYVSLKQVGVDFTLLPSSEIAQMTEMAKPIWEKWAKDNGPIAEEALKLARQAVGK
ncbi:MAG: TRAP transporter substrate-binding protein DctP [Chloroflexota bacterium]